MTYIVIWKDSPGQQVSTTVDANNEPIQRNEEYVLTNGILPVFNENDVHSTLDAADGTKIAVTPALARTALGWDV